MVVVVVMMVRERVATQLHGDALIVKWVELGGRELEL